MQIRITRSARKWKIGNTRIIEAMEDAGTPLQAAGDQLLYVGRDARGLLLEVIAVPDDKNPGGLAVIHAMPADWRKK